MKTVHNCGFSQTAQVTGHYVHPDDRYKTFCGRQIKGTRWTYRWSGDPDTLGRGDCKKCIAKASVNDNAPTK